MQKVKYPRTYLLPFSPSGPSTSSDKIMKDCSCFDGEEVVVLIKYDGENFSLYKDYCHARSLAAPSHPSQTWIKNFHSSIKHYIPDGWRICCENMYGKHTIHYHNLPFYMFLLSVWNESNICLSWDETLEWSEVLGVPTPKQLYRGIWDETLVKQLYSPIIDGDECEGFVVRNVRKFPYGEFQENVAKWVRASHVSTDKHWAYNPVVKNMIKH